MNISEATSQVEGAIKAYLSKDEFGAYRIPFMMQRPLILMGPPGIGKTAVVDQIAQRMHINFVSYSITHHTRQSALGLPYIDTSEFAGQQYRVSRYTMSEIIAAVHDAIQKTGISEGILFLDEINCASETLMPAMLQFLQYKTFGQHQLPAGWVIVCAGNPPEYNRAAREFDPAMMDRMKRIDIEANLDVWQKYAVTSGVHPAITTFLSNKPEAFYKVRAAATGARIVTARGWEDLSRMIYAYDAEKIKVDLNLISQYIQDGRIAEDFSLYLDLFRKYEDDYKVADILDGSVDSSIVSRAADAPFDERIAVVNLLISVILNEVHAQQIYEQSCRALKNQLVALAPTATSSSDMPVLTKIDECASQATTKLVDAQNEGKVSSEQLSKLTSSASLWEQIRMQAHRAAMEPAVQSASVQDANAMVFSAAKEAFNDACRVMAQDVHTITTHVNNGLAFLEASFGSAQEMLVLVSRLSCDHVFMAFVCAHPIEAFVQQSKALMFHERGLDLLEEAQALVQDQEIIL
ncbi:MAG: MoxR family ATPase [Atopobium minutum]|nr:MoxR family ATPase [Atopobium minutum]